MNIKMIITIFLLNLGFTQTYNVGDTVTMEDQNIELDVCYGGEGYVKLADFNGNINGGDYNIIFIAMSVAS